MKEDMVISNNAPFTIQLLNRLQREKGFLAW